MHDHAAMTSSHDRRTRRDFSCGRAPGPGKLPHTPQAGSGNGGEDAGVRLNKYLAQSGLCSRRKADELVEAGRVSVNGRRAKAGDRVLPHDRVCVDGRLLGDREEPVCLMLHKPPKVVSTARDPQGRTTVLEYVPKEYRHLRLYPVGRLDYLSEGLILLTNDGALAQRLAHPSNNQRKVYEVEVRGSVTERVLSTLRGGMTLQEGDVTAPCEVEVLGPAARQKAAKTTLLRFVLHQGLNRQIRRMCRDVGLAVQRLCRVAEGNLELGSLPPGRTRVLAEKDLRLLREDGQKLHAARAAAKTSPAVRFRQDVHAQGKMRHRDNIPQSRTKHLLP